MTLVRARNPTAVTQTRTTKVIKISPIPCFQADKFIGARVAGKITVDMTPIIQQGHIQPATIKPGYDGKPHYKIEFDLVIIINGRNLRYEARWPVGSAETRSQGQICIAAAFRPGTK